jgi:hypothetical protein
MRSCTPMRFGDPMGGWSTRSRLTGALLHWAFGGVWLPRQELREARNFFLGHFSIFFQSCFQNGAGVPELGHMTFFLKAPLFLNDPIFRARPWRISSLDDSEFWSLAVLAINDDLRKIARISCSKQ